MKTYEINLNSLEWNRLERAAGEAGYASAKSLVNEGNLWDSDFDSLVERVEAEAAALEAGDEEHYA
jgi:hypothetical protein